MVTTLSPYADHLIRSTFAALEESNEAMRSIERQRTLVPSGGDFSDLSRRHDAAVAAYDAAAFTLGLALGDDPDTASAWTHTALLEKAWASTRDTLPVVPDAPRLTLLPPTPPLADGLTPVEQLAHYIGWSVEKTRRLAHLFPGVAKLDPSKQKSHWVIPDPEDSARRYLNRERREQ